MKLDRMIRNSWIYRRVIALAVLLGIALAFVLWNGETVQVQFPFLGPIHGRSGVVMLLSALLGAAVTWLVMTFRHTLREARQKRATTVEPATRPKTGNEAKTPAEQPPSSSDENVK